MTRGSGRPLRFLGAVIAGWVGIRVVMLWPYAGSAESLPRGPRAEAARAVVVGPRPAASIAVSVSHQPGLALVWRHGFGTAMAAHSPDRTPPVQGVTPTAPAAVEAAPPPMIAGLPRAASPPQAPSATSAPPSRLSGSFWLVARGGDGLASAPLGGQLGGSQAGLRLAYLLNRKRRIAVAARATSPLGAGLREAAIGLEWQPTRLPVRLVAEQRIALGAGKGGPAAGVVGGFGPLGIGSGFRLEGYGQAGAIHRDRTEGFVDGAVHASHRLTSIAGAPIDLGAGLWGGAQRGAERLDVGPSVSATLPIAGRYARLSLDWRERVAGQARPGSGVALTLGADF